MAKFAESTRAFGNYSIGLASRQVFLKNGFLFFAGRKISHFRRLSRLFLQAVSTPPPHGREKAAAFPRPPLAFS
nr:hypothetical protein [uncultured Dysosmobacter sp.]